MVKIISESGKEEKFDSKDIEKELEASGLPEKVAEEVAERVEDRVEDHWTNAKVNEQIDIELRRLEEDIQRARGTFERKVMKIPTTMPERSEQPTAQGNRTETFVPESERERHRY